MDSPIETRDPHGSMMMRRLYPSGEVVIDTAPLHTSFSIELLREAHGQVLEAFDFEGEGHIRVNAANGRVVYRVWRYRADVGVLDCVRAAVEDSHGVVTPALGGHELRGISLAGIFG